MKNNDFWNNVKVTELPDGRRIIDYYDGTSSVYMPSDEELAAERKAREDLIANGPDTRLCRRVEDPLKWECHRGLKDMMGILNDVANGEDLSIKDYTEKSRIEPPWGTLSWERKEAIYIVLGGPRVCMKDLWEEFNLLPKTAKIRKRINEIYNISNLVKGYQKLANNSCQLHARPLAFHCPYVQTLFSPYRALTHWNES